MPEQPQQNETPKRDRPAKRRATRGNNRRGILEAIRAAIDRDRQEAQRLADRVSLRGVDPYAPAFRDSARGAKLPWRTTIGDATAFLVFEADGRYLGRCIGSYPTRSAARRRALGRGRVVAVKDAPQREVEQPIAGLRALIHIFVTQPTPDGKRSSDCAEAVILAEALRRPVEVEAVSIYPTWKAGRLAEVPDAVAALADEVLLFPDHFTKAERQRRRRALRDPIRGSPLLWVFDSAWRRVRRYGPPPACHLPLWLVMRWHDVKNMTATQIAVMATEELEREVSEQAVFDATRNLGLSRRMGRPPSSPSNLPALPRANTDFWGRESLG